MPTSAFLLHWLSPIPSWQVLCRYQNHTQPPSEGSMWFWIISGHVPLSPLLWRHAHPPLSPFYDAIVWQANFLGILSLLFTCHHEKMLQNYKFKKFVFFSPYLYFIFLFIHFFTLFLGNSCGGPILHLVELRRGSSHIMRFILYTVFFTRLSFINTSTRCITNTKLQ